MTKSTLIEIFNHFIRRIKRQNASQDALCKEKLDAMNVCCSKKSFSLFSTGDLLLEYLQVKHFYLFFSSNHQMHLSRLCVLMHQIPMLAWITLRTILVSPIVLLVIEII